MAERSYFFRLVVPPAHEANLMTPSEEGMGGGVVRGQLERVLEIPQRS